MSQESETGLLLPAVVLAFRKVSGVLFMSPNQIQTRMKAGIFPVENMDRAAGFTSQQLAGFPFSATSVVRRAMGAGHSGRSCH